MKNPHWLGVLVLVLIPVLVIGCGGSTTGKPAKESDAPKGPFAKLSPADRRLAESQATCPISKKPLESMDGPVKIMVQGQPVFLCCDGCRDDALADPAKTLADVKTLKAKTAAP